MIIFVVSSWCTRSCSSPTKAVRAWDLLAELESNGRLDPGGAAGSLGPAFQLSLLSGSSLVDDALAEIDVSNLTPLQAITELYRLQEMAGRDGDDG